jgi:predicted nucleotidyltransferase
MMAHETTVDRRHEAVAPVLRQLRVKGKCMEEAIRRELEALEKKAGITILLAVESGSRAWGFASQDSDYDVRFLYVRPKEAYLRLEPQRDVIEHLLNDVLDINGWDIGKALRLMHSSNPTLFEWLSSPIVYMERPFAQQLRAASGAYFLAKPGLHHYLSMAGGNYREYLKGDSVRLKKYFYVLRPLLACRHILSRGTPPPMLFQTLLHSQMDSALIPVVERLMEQKRRTPELGEGPRIAALNDFIEAELPALEERISKMPHAGKASWEGLNALFLQALEQKPEL